MRHTLFACQDNSAECLACKNENAISKKRYKIWLRANVFSIKGKKPEELLKNPFNIKVYGYHQLEIRIPEKNELNHENYWRLPPILRSDL